MPAERGKLTECTRQPSRKGRLGYATTSLKSALIMRAVDWLNPLQLGDAPFVPGARPVISCAAGLGDLIIQLPLISGLVRKFQREGRDARVALRPSHAEIGEVCGWNVLRFENPLQDFFGGTLHLGIVGEVLRCTAELRRQDITSWLDLSGNAFNALAIRLGGVKMLASKVTRGGGSLIHHRLANDLFENEYAYRRRLAEILECELDNGVYSRLAPRRKPRRVVLGITTSSRWRNWPISRFLELVLGFPDERFIATGSLREVGSNDAEALGKLRECPNVEVALGHLELMQLIECAANAKAVVTNDTSIAHIANAFDRPGAVLFGPGISEQWATPRGLRVFQDRSCAHYPCTSWSCVQPAEWCMEKIAVRDVAEYLGRLLHEP
jgi:ADP-heptose:LPS heptosyltransferase